jgi:RHS repeat-associated protein
MQAARYTYVYGDDLLSQERPGGAFSFFHYDGQLSTRQLTDSNAQVTDSYSFDAFGVMLAQSGSTPNNHLYTGEQLDPNVGLYYLRARYLNHSAGRFISQDILSGVEQDPSTLHKYLYAGVDPIQNLDPSGGFFIGVIATLITLTITAALVLYVRGTEVTVKFAVLLEVGLAVASIVLVAIFNWLVVTPAQREAIGMLVGSRVLARGDPLFKKVEDATEFIRKSKGGERMATTIKLFLDNNKFRVGPRTERVAGVTLAGAVPVIAEEIIRDMDVEEVAVVIMGEYEHVGHFPRANEEERAQDAFNLWLQANGLNERYGEKYRH